MGFITVYIYMYAFNVCKYVCIGRKVESTHAEIVEYVCMYVCIYVSWYNAFSDFLHNFSASSPAYLFMRSS